MSVKRNYILQLSNSLLNIAFPLITFPYAAKILDPTGIGEVQYVFSYALYFSILAGLGIPIYGIKIVSEKKNKGESIKRVTGELLVIGIISSIIASIIFYFLAQFLFDWKSNNLRLIFASSLVWLSILNLDWLFSGLEKFKTLALRSLIVKLIVVGFLFAKVNSSSDLLEYLTFLILTYILGYAYNFYFLVFEIKPSFKGLNLKQHISPLLLILSMTIATTVYTTLDMVFLGYFSSYEEVGIYTAAVKFAKVSIPVLASMSIVLIPKISGTQLFADDHSHNLLKKSFSFSSLIAIPISVGIWVLRYEIIILFSGETFISGVTSLAILSFAPLFIGFGHFAAYQILLPLNRNRALFASTFVGMLFFVMISFILIPSYGAKGVSIANISTEILVTVGYFMFIPKHILQSLPWIKIFKAFLTASLFYPIYLIISSIDGLNTISVFCLTILSCTSLYFLIQMVLWKDYIVKSSFDKLIKRN